MKLFSPKIMMLILLLSPMIVVGQTTGPKEIVGVEDGDTFSYVISSKFGLDDNEPLFTGRFNNMSLSAGETFQLTVVDNTPSLGNTIELELSNSEGNISYTNDLARFDFVIFRDFEFWAELLTDNGWSSYLDDEIFSFSFLLQDNDLIFYLEYTYLVESGVNTHQLVYVAPASDINSPISFISIDMGETPVPIPDISDVSFAAGQFYDYQVLASSGYNLQPALMGLEDGLRLRLDENFRVSPLSAEGGATDSVLVSIQTEDDGIIYNNRLDFQNSINAPAFFLYTDWDYLGDYLDIQIENTISELEIGYDFTNTQFIYNEEFTDENGFYSLELRYDIERGVLISLSLIQEDVSESTKTLEFTLIDEFTIDTSKFNLNLDKIYEYEVLEFVPISSSDKFFVAENDDLALFKGDTFGIEILTSPDKNNRMATRVTGPDGSLILTAQLDTLGSFFIFPDWEYWSIVVEFLDSLNVEDVDISFTEDDSIFTIERTVDIGDITSTETMVYQKKNGILESYKFTATGIDNEGNDIVLIVSFELKNKANNDDSPGLSLPIGLFAILAVAIVIRRSKKSVNS